MRLKLRPAHQGRFERHHARARRGPRASAQLGRILAAGTLLIAALGVASAPPRAYAQALDPHVPPPEGACTPVSVTIVGLPQGAQAGVVLSGPSGYRHIFNSSGSVCLNAAGTYALVSEPVALGSHQTAYPTTPGGALSEQSIAVDVPSPPTPLAKAVTLSFYDQAPDTTFVLSPGLLVVPSGRQLASSGSFTLVNSPATSGISNGDIIVAPVTASTPHGLLGRVTAVNKAASALAVTTVPVSPFRAFSQAELTVAATAPAPVSTPLSGPGQTGGAEAAPAHRSTTAASTQSGCSNAPFYAQATFQPAASLNLGWHPGPWYAPWQVEITGSFSLSPNMTGSVAVDSPSGLNCTASTDLGPYPIGTIWTEFGSFTLNLVADASLSGDIDGEIDQTIDFGLTGSAGASFRFGGGGNGFSPSDTLGLSGSSGGSTSPWQGSLNVDINPALQVLYGIEGLVGAGPQVGVNDQTTLTGNSGGWSLQGALEGTVGVAFEALGYSYDTSVSIPLVSRTLDAGPW